jgi:hypothetical protein
MNKYPLIGVSFCAVVLLVLGSLSNVVGYQTVQSSNQKIIQDEVNQKELLFQTIVDIVNNKEIQRIILKSQMSRGMFPISDIPLLTKNQLKQMYFFGLILSKVISRTRMQSMVQQYQSINPEMQQEIFAVIENNPTLNGEITQLQNSECDCENENTTDWNFPIICGILAMLFFYHIFMATIFLKIMETLLNKPILDGILYVIGLYQFIQSFAISFLLNLMC